MGSLRNPVGPLPSTIYWRRRAIAAALIALLALLVLWMVNFGGSDGKKKGDVSDGANPATSITPGPSGSGPAISEQPGGREESGDADENTGGTEGGSGSGTADGNNGDPGTTTAGAGGTGSAGAGTGGAAGTSGAGGAGGTGTGGATGGTANGGAGGAGTGTGTGTGTGDGSTTSGRLVGASSSLPNCAPKSLTLSLTTTKVAYAPGEKPAFRLSVRNTSDTTCKADFGPKAMVLTVTDAEDEQVWSSADCPKTGGLYFEVPAGQTVIRTVQWNRARSAPQCATPPAGAVGPGTYLVEAKTSRAVVQLGQQSIRLDKD
ncbi:hypothetical protein KQY30_14835 [Streptomyces sp. GMY02]|uniref:hypothetical protein n=1 Tax=Streptomyces sp. GMY02 TaxID=1333528 RepID=UPI001C2C2DB2|nr:hypothetical protein [Streptomyces sp. GMY02]QXE35355.1 hypothetical protein KQY30_14835 [Streptomyces sp. GMY02]